MTTDVIKTADLEATGVPRHVIDLKCRPGGPWQRILPGVLLLGAAPPTRGQRLRAALAYAGPEAVVTGIDALHAQGLPTPPSADRALPTAVLPTTLLPTTSLSTAPLSSAPLSTTPLPTTPLPTTLLPATPPSTTLLPATAVIHLLQPAARRRACTAQILLERTTRPPAVVIRDGLRLAAPTRAVLDAARHEPRALRRHHLLATAVRSGLCTLAGLEAELAAGSKRGSAGPRAALRTLKALLR